MLRPVLGPQYREDVDELEQVEQRAPEIVEAGALLPCEKGLRELGLLSWEKDHCRKPNRNFLLPARGLLKR